MLILCYADNMSEQDRRELEAICAPHTFLLQAENSLNIDLVRQAEVLVGSLSRQVLSHADSVRYVLTANAGYEKQLAALPRQDVIMTSGGDVYADAMSEMVLSMLLTVMKKLHLQRDRQRERRWQDESAMATLSGSNVLVVGCGYIGSALGRKLSALGAEVTGIRRSGAPAAGIPRVFGPDRLLELLPDMDSVITILPGTRETFHLLDERAFAAMKEGVFFVNAGRGEAVDTAALTAAAASGKIAGACIDVFEQEPLPADHPLWGMDNILITPHIAGMDYVPPVRKKLIALYKENLRRYFAGEPLLNLIDRERGYGTL